MQRAQSMRAAHPDYLSTRDEVREYLRRGDGKHPTCLRRQFVSKLCPMSLQVISRTSRKLPECLTTPCRLILLVVFMIFIEQASDASSHPRASLSASARKTRFRSACGPTQRWPVRAPCFFWTVFASRNSCAATKGVASAPWSHPDSFFWSRRTTTTALNSGPRLLLGRLRCSRLRRDADPASCRACSRRAGPRQGSPAAEPRTTVIKWPAGPSPLRRRRTRRKRFPQAFSIVPSDRRPRSALLTRNPRLPRLPAGPGGPPRRPGAFSCNSSPLFVQIYESRISA